MWKNLFFHDLLFASVLVYAWVFQEICTQYPIGSILFVIEKSIWCNIPTTFSILFASFHITLRFFFFFFSIDSAMFVCVEYVAAITRYSVVAAWFCLIIRSYSLNVSFEIGCTEIRLYCNCDIVSWIYKYKYWKFISFCRLNFGAICAWNGEMGVKLTADWASHQV